MGGAFGLVCAEFGGRGEEAVLGVVDDLRDGFGRLFVRVGFGEVAAGDLETVEEEAGAARVEVVGGDAEDDFAYGVLDGGAVLGSREREAGL